MKDEQETKDKIVKKDWQKPSISQLDITQTAGGLFDVDYEGPYNFLLGDYS